MPLDKNRIQSIRRRHTPVERLSRNGHQLLTVCPTCRSEGCDSYDLIQALLETTDALDAWIRAYANVDPAGQHTGMKSPEYEVNLFRVWLMAVGAMGYKAEGALQFARELQGKPWAQSVEPDAT